MMTNIPDRTDVVVIGGGPAGSMAATFLSQKGYQVVLLEKQKHPRPHVGENIIPHVWKYTDLAGVSDKIAAEGFIKKAGGTVVWNGTIRQMAFKDFGYDRPAFHVERDIFDQILLENAREQGAQVFEEVSVSEVEFNDSTEEQSVSYRHVKEKTTGKISCRFVVDASGQNAVVARQLGIRVIDEGFRFMSMWGYFKGSKYTGFDGQVHPFEELRTIPPTTFVSSIAETGDWGWSWHIPLRETTSVGLILPLEFMKTAKTADQSWESYFIRKCYEIPILNHLLENAEYCEGSFAKIQDYSYRSTQVAGPGYFLIGDAAGFIDPIFSVGVILGMYSAYIATWAIDRSFKKPDSVAHNQALFTSQLEGRFEVSRSLALPRYQPGDGVSDLAKTAVKFESTLEKELMDVVSKMTTRNENFAALAQDEHGQKVTSDKYKVISKIAL
jgi:flavin-dependent dehydrogenase